MATEVMWLMLVPAESVGSSSSRGAMRLTYVFRPMPISTSMRITTKIAASTIGCLNTPKATQQSTRPTWLPASVLRSPSRSTIAPIRGLATRLTMELVISSALICQTGSLNWSTRYSVPKVLSTCLREPSKKVST